MFNFKENLYRKLDAFSLDYLIKKRIHLGHIKSNINKNINSYLYSIHSNSAIFDINKIWNSLKYLYYNLSELFYKRNSFFIVGTNPNLPMEKLLKNWLNSIDLSKFNSFYISGYIDKKWIGGMFSNWKIFYAYIKYIKNFKEDQKIKFKYEKYFQYLKGIIYLKKKPIPDFIILLDKDSEALHEIKNLDIPLIGIIDSDMNPDDFVYKFWGNNDSVVNLRFFFLLLKEACLIGRAKEQQLFIYFLIKNIKKKISTI